ncbi:MAG: hypothetical protein JRC93_13635 [Deltaproteobacteria bacterium]|nr:hypothetical protein [Deltaproteobacteria bacterium]
MAEKKTSPSGLGLPGVLFLIFLVLKLTDNIDWSWGWVFSPVWIPAVVAVVLVLVAGIVALINRMIDGGW